MEAVEQMVVDLAQLGDNALSSMEQIREESQLFFAQQTKSAELLESKLVAMNEKQLIHLEHETQYFAKASLALEYQQDKMEGIQEKLSNLQIAMSGFVRFFVQ